jgi:hypothetical protein
MSKALLSNTVYIEDNGKSKRKFYAIKSTVIRNIDAPTTIDSFAHVEAVRAYS